MNANIHTICLVFPALLLVQAHAAVTTQIDANLTDPHLGGGYGGNASGSTEGEAITLDQNGLSSQPDNYLLSATAIAGHGILKASVTETRTGTYAEEPPFTWTGGSNLNSIIFAYASFTDSLTVAAAGREGQEGTAVFRFRVDGWSDLSYTAPMPNSAATPAASDIFSVSAGWGLYIGAIGEQEFADPENLASESYRGDFDSNTGFHVSGAASPDGTYEFRVPFTYGEAFGIEYTLVVGVDLINGDPSGTIIGEATASFLNTAELEEIEFQDAGGTTVSGASLSTLSGTNYNVVPEPSGLLFGLLGVFLALRRRR